MPTPAIPEAERQKRKAAVEAALRDGFAPHRQRGGRGSSAAEAARRLGVKRTKIDGWIVAEEQLRSRGEPHFLPDWSLYAEPTVDIQPAAVEERSAVQALQDEITRLKAELKAAYRASVEEDAILSLIGVMAGAEANPPIGATDTGKGTAWLRVNQEVPWTTALKILELLKGEKGE